MTFLLQFVCPFSLPNCLCVSSLCGRLKSQRKLMTLCNRFYMGGECLGSLSLFCIWNGAFFIEDMRRTSIICCGIVSLLLEKRSYGSWWLYIFTPKVSIDNRGFNFLGWFDFVLENSCISFFLNLPQNHWDDTSPNTFFVGLERVVEKQRL